MTGFDNRAGLAMFFVAVAGPFYLNDFANILVQDWRAWLVIDYTFAKLLPLCLLGWALSRPWLKPADLGLGWPGGGLFGLAFAVAALVGTLMDQNAYTLLAGWPGYAPLGGMPSIPSAAWNWCDLTVGLLLVAVLEETLFRGLAHTVLSRYTARASLIVLASAAAFGLIHWSLGLHAVLITGLIGAVFMGVYLRCRSVVPLILAHFAVNFIDFAGVIPKSLFKWV
ncbi:MAG: CPBP family intramembrane metalloprotease [Ramlibacter sp.]|nr:CPBP family intramembrane metalloprotease [Ramlibacter sp.]